MKEAILFEPLFRATISVVDGCNFNEFFNLITSRHGDEPLISWDKEFKLEEGTDGYQFHVCGGAEAQDERFYVWLFRDEPYQRAHEFCHLVNDILFTRGIVYCSESEETFAYLTGRLHEMYAEQTKVFLRNDES